MLTSPARSDELPPATTRPVNFTQDIQPLLQKRCWSCHGSEKQESGLRLDRREALLLGGDQGPAVVSGKSADSRLIRYVAGTDPDNIMPPEGPPLSKEEVGLLRAWIDQGCTWPDSTVAADKKNTHWSYQPLHVVPPPEVRRRDWPANAIDHFVLTELERRGVAPSPEADRPTLIRRLSLDLTGLLPSVEEVDTFVNDPRSEAYAALVDRLLDSPHFGERWGRHWLDMARYADSDGYEKDNPRPDAYRWRDWVIDAINADMPFDQFTVEQLAGDLLPEATPMQKLATAFHRQTLTNTEGGTDQEQFRVEACFDRTETTGAVWLGLTVGCARCHTHKYDAITQREYYQLFSFFNNGDENTAVVPKSEREIAEYEVAKAAYDRTTASLQADLRTAQEKHAPAFAAWEEKAQAILARMIAEPVQISGIDEIQYACDETVTFTPQKDGSVLVEGENPDRATYTVTGHLPRSAATAPIKSIRIHCLDDSRLPNKGPGRVGHGNFVLSEVVVEVASAADFSDARRLTFASAEADFEQADKPWLAKNVYDGKTDTGWAIGPKFGESHDVMLYLTEPLTSPTADTVTHIRVRLQQEYGQQHTIGRFRVALRAGFEPDVKIPDAIKVVLETPVEKRTDAQRQELADHISRQEAATKPLIAKLDAHYKAKPPKPEVKARILLQRTKEPRETFILRRGEFLEPVKDSPVAAGGLATLPGLVSRVEGQPADRLDLARWLVSPDNPLPPRVTVNHVWRYLFGEGLVRSVADFGIRGERPSHPELLDWLAADFIGRNLAADGASRTPWSRKALIRQIVLSATYRQSSRHRPELHDLDPQNVWLARQNRLRVEGEIVRDISLDVAGLLSRKVGGPSVFPPLPPGIAELSYAGNFKWTVSSGEDRLRRGMYTFFKRTSPHPNLTTFDCPDANLTCIERQASNTPLQALVTLNNETFAEAARGLAKRLLYTDTAADDDPVRLARGFRLCVARTPTAAEQAELNRLLADAVEWYRAHPDQAKPLIGTDAIPGVAPETNAAWVATARILLNLDEFITRE